MIINNYVNLLEDPYRAGSHKYGLKTFSIVINMKNCTKAVLTEREITSVMYHELGHLLNVPDLEPEPTLKFCFIHHIEFNRALLDDVRTSNYIKMEFFADSYANRHGYGTELISTFHKQSEYFEQKMGYCATRIDRIQNNNYLEGKIVSLDNHGS